MLFNFSAKIFCYQAGTLQERGTGRNTRTPLIYNPLNRLTVQAMPKPFFLAGFIPYGGCGAAVEEAAGFCVWRSQIRIIKGFFWGRGRESRPPPGWSANVPGGAKQPDVCSSGL